jgi:integrase
LRRVFRYHRERAGVPAGHPHALRHTFGTALELSTVAADASFDRVNNSGSARKAALLASA